MDDSINFGGVVLFWFVVVARIRQLFLEGQEYWSVALEFEFLGKVDRLAKTVASESGCLPEQLDKDVVLGPKAMQDLREIDAWLVQQLPRLSTG